MGDQLIFRTKEWLFLMLCRRNANYILLFQSFTSHERGTITDLHDFAPQRLQMPRWPYDYLLKKQFSSEENKPAQRKTVNTGIWRAELCRVNVWMSAGLAVRGVASLAVVLIRGTGWSASGPAVLFQSLLCKTQGHNRLMCATKSVPDFPWNTKFLLWLANLSDPFRNSWIMNTATALVE